jgi:signal transduction histidine kinase
MTPRHFVFAMGACPSAIYAHRFAGCEVNADDSYSKPVLSHALRSGCATIHGIHTAAPLPASLEQRFSALLCEVKPERGIRLRIFIEGKQQALRPAIQEQLFLICREAVVNALRHSKATKIDVEAQYLRCSVRLFVRDNGCGINPDVVQKKSDSYWGVRQMRDRAETIGAQFGIWSRPGAGTEVRISVPFDAAMAEG